jgi:hypothetical protein
MYLGACARLHCLTATISVYGGSEASLPILTGSGDPLDTSLSLILYYYPAQMAPLLCSPVNLLDDEALARL